MLTSANQEPDNIVLICIQNRAIMKLASAVLVVAIIASTSLSIPDASAQFGGMGGPFGGARGGRMDRGGRGGESQGINRESRNERPVVTPDSNSFEQIDYRLSLLQEDIKLTAEQSAAWQSFASKARAYAGDLARERTRGAVAVPANLPPPANGLQHISQAVDGARNRLAALEEVETSAKALYQTLTPSQKTLADLRIPAIIAPRPAISGGIGAGSNLPDLGSSRPY